MKRKIILALALCLIIAGIVVIIYPQAQRYAFDKNTEKTIKEEIEKYKDMELEDLYLLMQEYNKNIYLNKQAGLVDPFSYEESSFDLSKWGMSENRMGYIYIPAMDVQLLVYLGASKAHMDLGAVHLSNTSLPIGGINTNTVIAGHRGFRGARMFQDIDKLVIGDTVFIVNFWETLTYKVSDIKIIAPDDTNKVLIQEGKDMLTLISCHPRRHNYQRYVVYCERAS